MIDAGGALPFLGPQLLIVRSMQIRVLDGSGHVRTRSHRMRLIHLPNLITVSFWKIILPQVSLFSPADPQASQRSHIFSHAKIRKVSILI